MRKRTILTLYVITVIAIFTYFTQAGEIRTWSSKSGESIEAQLIRLSNNYIVLQATNGKPVKIQKIQLAEQDLEYLDKLDALNELAAVLEDNAFELRGTIKRFSGNDIMLSSPVRVKTSIIPDPDDKIKRMKPILIKKEKFFPVTHHNGLAIVMGARRNIDITGAEWSGTVYPCGTKKINKKKVKFFSVSLRLAKQQILTTIQEDELTAAAIRKLAEPMIIEKEKPTKPQKIRMK
jgi:hypothetical protein